MFAYSMSQTKKILNFSGMAALSSQMGWGFPAMGPGPSVPEVAKPNLKSPLIP
jgi:hypothetical protein